MEFYDNHRCDNAAVTPTTSGDYDWAHKGDGMYTIEIPASGGASINNDTEGFGWFTGFCTGVLPWCSPIICFRAAGINNLLIDSAYSATRGLVGTAVPDAVADAAGGLTISDAGGLDLDAILADTAEIQGDLMNGGRLDLLIDELTVQGDTNESALAICTAYLDELGPDWYNGGRLDLIIDAIAADTNELQVDNADGGRTDLLIDELTVQGDTNEAKIDTIDTVVDAVLVDTDELQTDITNGGRTDLILDELTTQGDTNEGKLDTIDTVVDAIKLITDSLQVKKNTVLANYLFLMVDETDGRTGKTGLTITAERSIDGAAFAACANSATELSAGVYIIDLAASDLNGNTIMLKFSATDADTRLISIVTVP